MILLEHLATVNTMYWLSKVSIIREETLVCSENAQVVEKR